MADTLFDLALMKRFDDSTAMTLVDVSPTDALLIHDVVSNTIMKIPMSVLSAAITGAVSGAQIVSALGYTPEDSAKKGAANGYAGLDASGRVPSAQLPAYVDDVLEYANLAAFPATGSSGVIYIALDTNKTYRWGGSAYTEISPSPGSTDSVTEGSVNLYFTNARASAAAPVQSVAGKTGAVTLAKGDVGLGNVDNTSDANKPVSTAQQTALDLKADAAQPAWTAPTLLNGWQNLGSGYEPAGYKKDTTGTVWIKGQVKSGSGVIFTLPSGYRPANSQLFVTSGDALFAEIIVASSGNVSIHAGAATVYLTLNFSFRV